ncbi:hypothetical protein OPV22_005284 [Ensete ventricosum]|nr:hypothetical protein OPV22_005284 [Ensete ventricosum]
MGIDPVTHKPFSHLMAEIATTLAPPQVAHLAEAALGCFKDEMLHLLTKKRTDFASAPAAITGNAYTPERTGGGKEETIEKIKLGLSKAIMHDPDADKVWTMMASAGEPSDGLAGLEETYPTLNEGFRYDGPSYGNEGEGSAWSQSTCTGGAAARRGGGLHDKVEDDNGEEAEGGKAEHKVNAAGMFTSECVLWDLPDDLMIHPIV